jgi:RNA polymerase sigma-70 factor (sigma-E family)
MTVDDEFRQFVELRYGDLIRTAYALTSSAHDAEDLVQSALVKAMGRWRRIDDPMAYLRRTMVNQHINGWRRLRVRELVSESPPAPPVTDTAEVVAEREMLHAALRALSRRTRAVVVLRYVADLPEAEVAATLGLPVGTVKSHASRGLARLRAALGDGELTVTEGGTR